MQIKGEVRSAKVSRKIDDAGRQHTVVDLRVKIPMHMKVPVMQIVELTGSNAILEVEKAQLSLEEAVKE
jgi:hypothetical protein